MTSEYVPFLNFLVLLVVLYHCVRWELARREYFEVQTEILRLATRLLEKADV